MENLIGRVFGGWVVIAYTGYNERGHVHEWECRCECGTVKVIRANTLRSKGSQSCGCKRAPFFQKTHGLVESNEYTIWHHIIRRCTDPRVPEYQKYGAQGISVCDRWRFGEKGSHGFLCFLQDLGRRPTKGHSVDRRDALGPYEPWNCYWATRREQALNRRSSMTVLWNGERRVFLEAVSEAIPSVIRKRETLGRALTLQEIFDAIRDT